MNVKELVEKYGRAQIGVDGTAAFALLGENLQEGECEFVDVLKSDTFPIEDLQRSAAFEALRRLRVRLNLPNLSYYLGESHPMHLG